MRRRVPFGSEAMSPTRSCAFSARILLLPLALLSFSRMNAQDAALLPELRNELQHASDDTARALAMARICFNMARTDADSARRFGYEALTLAKRIGNPRAIADAHNNLGWLDTQGGRPDSADLHLGKALEIFRKLGRPEFTAVTLSNIGWACSYRGDQVGALEHFQEALEQSELAKDSASTAVALYNIGTTYRRMKQMGKALEHLEQSLAIERALGRSVKQAACLQAIANVHNENGETAQAMANYKEAYATYLSHGDLISAGIVQENMGDLYSEKEPIDALRYYGAALTMYEQAGSLPDQAYVLRRIAAMEIILGRHAEARLHLATGLEIAKRTGAAEAEMEYEWALVELHGGLNDGRDALRHMKRFLALKDSLQGAATQTDLARLRTEFETERKEKDNELLRSQNSEQTERLRRRGIMLYGSIVIGIMAIGAALLFWRNYKQKRMHADVQERLNRELAASNAEITEINSLLEMKLLRSQMNPHFIYNGLSSAARMAQEGKQLEAVSYLQGFARLLRAVLDHSVNDKVSIAEEMEFLRQYLKLESYRLQGLEYEVIADQQLIDQDAEIPALLVQPFVENAIWHGLSARSGRRMVHVRFSGEPDRITCVIDDNGIGRSKAAIALGNDHEVHTSLGMQLTSERLRLLARRLNDSGAIQVIDKVDAHGESAGTTVVIQIT